MSAGTQGAHLSKRSLTRELVHVMLCPACGSATLEAQNFAASSQESIEDGIVLCHSCRVWYPIEAGVLELLAGELAYDEDRRRFADKHRAALEASGIRDGRDAVPGACPQQRHQQEHSDWYADNPLQTYSEYERLPFWQAVDQIMFEDWRRNLRPNQLVLDAGCAQGRSTSKLADQDLDIVGFDISKTLIQEAVRRADRKGWRARTTFFVADASKFPFRDDVFDAVLLYGVFHHLADPQVAAREVSRVLKPGGFCFALENNKTVLRAIFDALQRLRPAWFEEAGSHALMSAEELGGWLRDAGMTCDLQTTVFLPPHLLNLLSSAAGVRLVRTTDALLHAIPFARGQGDCFARLLANHAEPGTAVLSPEPLHRRSQPGADCRTRHRRGHRGPARGHASVDRHPVGQRLPVRLLPRGPSPSILRECDRSYSTWRSGRIRARNNGRASIRSRRGSRRGASSAVGAGKSTPYCALPALCRKGVSKPGRRLPFPGNCCCLRLHRSTAASVSRRRCCITLKSASVRPTCAFIESRCGPV